MIGVNVAQLLKSPSGTTRELEFREVEADVEQSAGVRGPLHGRGRLIRTGRGVLARVEYEATVELQCGRCIESFHTPISGVIEDEFLPSVDLATGRPLPETGEEPRLTENHVLDLTDLLRQDILLNLPLLPLCQEACPGLCPECGVIRSREACACHPVARESPFAALADLLEGKPGPDGKKQPHP